MHLLCPAAWRVPSAASTTGDLDLNEWVQNCLQMSGFFLDCNAFALSKHCCAAAEALLLQQYQRVQQQQQEASEHTPPSSTQDRDTAGDQAQQGPDQQGPSSTGSRDQTDSKDQADKQAQQQKEAAGKQPPLQPGEAVPGGPSAQLLAALSLLDDDVAANVCLAFGKLHLYTLVASHEAFLEGKQVPFAFTSAAQVPAVLSFDALQDLPALSSLAWGRDALVCSYDGALQLYKAALPWFKRALQHYQLDGWVTEHCNILFEMSNLYRLVTLPALGPWLCRVGCTQWQLVQAHLLAQHARPDCRRAAQPVNSGTCCVCSPGS